MNIPSKIFVTGIGTGVGKTLVSAILAEALEADYWKPVQSGLAEGTDGDWVRSVLTNRNSIIHPEAYRLQMPASPHIAAAAEGVEVNIDRICEQFPALDRKLIVEGAGGLLVPLNSRQTMADLVLRLNTPLILVSRHYLGSINHSLLTAEYCRQRGIPVLGWIFNDRYLAYEDDIVRLSGYPRLFSVPDSDNLGKVFVQEQAKSLRESLNELLC